MDNNYGMIVNKRGWFLHAYQMYPLLASYGFMSNGSTIRPQGFVASRIQGDGVETFGSGLFRCSPAVKREDGKPNSKHRLEVQCTGCDKWLPFGRMIQHVKVHRRKAAEDAKFVERLNPVELQALAAPLLDKGITVIGLDDPAALHNLIKQTIGE